MDTGKWQTPLGYYEKAIQELMHMQESLQGDFKTLENNYLHTLQEINSLTTKLINTQESLDNNQKKSQEFQKKLAEAEYITQTAQQEIKLLKNMINEQNTNCQSNQELAEIKEQLALLIELSKPKNIFQDDVATQIIQSISGLQEQVAQLADELTLVSPASGLDYKRLQELLLAEKWHEADITTYNYILKKSERKREGWLDDGDIKKFPRHDLRIINNLWVKYSEGKFGFSVQKRIWRECKKDYKRFCDRVQWLLSLEKNEWRKYEDYNFSLEAPDGHLPSTVKILGLGGGNVGWLEHRLKIFMSRY